MTFTIRKIFRLPAKLVMSKAQVATTLDVDEQESDLVHIGRLVEVLVMSCPFEYSSL